MTIDNKRIQRIKKLLASNGIDALLCHLPENVAFLSGWWSLTGTSWIIFTSEGEEHLVVPSGESLEASCSGIDLSTFEYARLSAGDTQQSSVLLINSFLTKTGLEKGKIGIELNPENIAPPLNIAEPVLPGEGFWLKLKESLPGASFTDATSIINKLRIIKTPAEIERFRIVNEIAAFGLEVFQQEVNPGISEIELAMKVNSTIAIRGSEYKGVHSARGFSQISSGDRTLQAWRPCVITDNRELKKGDVVLLELAVVADGYWADVTRCAVAGGASRIQKEVYEVVLYAQTAARKAIRQGVMMSEVDRIAREIIGKAGYGDYFFHITGHGVGWRYHEFPPLLAPGNNTQLEEGMITSVEPGVYIPGIGGFRVEDNVAVGKAGCDTLTVFSRELL